MIDEGDDGPQTRLQPFIRQTPDFVGADLLAMTSILNLRNSVGANSFANAVFQAMKMRRMHRPLRE
jgi:hypothetical protein